MLGNPKTSIGFPGLLVHLYLWPSWVWIIWIGQTVCFAPLHHHLLQLRDGVERHGDVWLSPATKPDHSHRPGGVSLFIYASSNSHLAGGRINQSAQSKDRICFLFPPDRSDWSLPSHRPKISDILWNISMVISVVRCGHSTRQWEGRWYFNLGPTSERRLNKIVSCWYEQECLCFRKGRKRACLFNVVFNLWNTTVSSWIYLCSTENKGETDAERTKSIRRRKHKLFNKTPKKPNVAIKSVKNGWWQ